MTKIRLKTYGSAVTRSYLLYCIVPEYITEVYAKENGNFIRPVQS